VLMGTEHNGRCQTSLHDEVSELLFFGVAHASRIYDGSITAFFIIEDIGILLYRPEGKLVNLKHRIIMMIVLAG
jgi:hypothetical protein